MKRIYKYHLPFEESIKIRMPKDAEILTIQQDRKDNSIQMWCLVDPEKEEEVRGFVLVGTGADFNDSHLEYIGTYQYNGFVGHVFEAIL